MDQDIGVNKNEEMDVDPSQLCDLEFINLLKFCNELKLKHKETDEH
jgi:hypothetical protein